MGNVSLGNVSLVALQLPKVGNVSVFLCGISNRRGELSNTLSMKKEVCVCVCKPRESKREKESRKRFQPFLDLFYLNLPSQSSRLKSLISARLSRAACFYIYRLQRCRGSMCVCVRANTRFRPIGACVPTSAGVDWVTSPLGRVVMVINGWFYHL